MSGNYLTGKTCACSLCAKPIVGHKTCKPCMNKTPDADVISASMDVAGDDRLLDLKLANFLSHQSRLAGTFDQERRA